MSGHYYRVTWIDETGAPRTEIYDLPAEGPAALAHWDYLNSEPSINQPTLEAVHIIRITRERQP